MARLSKTSTPRRSGRLGSQTSTPTVSLNISRRSSTRRSTQSSPESCSSSNSNSSSSKSKSKSTPVSASSPCTSRWGIPTASEPQTISAQFAQAKQRLNVAAVPETLPCRDSEYAEILARTESALENRQGCCIYISGVPGTGKTCTVREVLRSLQRRSDQQELPAFDFVDINGMKLTDPNVAYTVLWQGLSGQKLSASQAEECLDQRFNAKRSTQQKKMCIALIDELDLLVTKKQQVMYNFFHWPSCPNSKLIVIAIANTMDLPERILSNKVSSRLGLTRVNFQMYTFQQLTEIIRSRLEGLNVFDDHAINFSARKVAAVSGDARRALDICRRAAEVAEATPQQEWVTVELVSKVIADMYASSGVKIISHLSLHQKLFLYALTIQFKQSGLDQTHFGEVAQKHIEFCRLYNVDPPTTSELASICFSLGSMRLLLVEAGKADLYQRIQLQVAEGDLSLAFRDDSFMQRIISTG